MEEDTRKYIYRVVNVEETSAPEGMQGNWHRYVIKRGESTIEGMQPGDLYDVTEHAEKFADSLNDRFTNGSYAYRSSAPKKKSPL